jgi:DNA invertase Pin-like site-specific DNA recombinase
MFQMCGVFAQFERSIIQERVKAGLERAKADGTKLGRPGLSELTKQEIVAMRATGMSMAKIAVELGISTGVVCKVVKQKNDIRRIIYLRINLIFLHHIKVSQKVCSRISAYWTRCEKLSRTIMQP